MTTNIKQRKINLHTKVPYFQLLIVVSISCLISFLKFSPCRYLTNGKVWTQKSCWTDIPNIYTNHFLDLHLWPLKEHFINELNKSVLPIEYPVLLSLLAWTLSYLIKVDTQPLQIIATHYFDLNVIILSLCLYISAIYIYKLFGKRYLLFIFSPAFIASLFINWDILVILFLILCLFYLNSNRTILPAIFLSIAISFKFYPIILVVPIYIYFLKINRKKSVLFLISLFATWFVINLPFVINNFQGWFYFYKFNFERGISYGSVWEILQIFGIDFKYYNFIYILSFIFGAIYLSYRQLKTTSENLYSILFLYVFIFLFFNKVYSPQYVIWLTFAAIPLIIKRNKLKLWSFFTWQISELIYHYGLWKYIYFKGYGRQIDGLNPIIYAELSLLRWTLLSLFALNVLRDLHRESR